MQGWFGGGSEELQGTGETWWCSASLPVLGLLQLGCGMCAGCSLLCLQPETRWTRPRLLIPGWPLGTWSLDGDSTFSASTQAMPSTTSHTPILRGTSGAFPRSQPTAIPSSTLPSFPSWILAPSTTCPTGQPPPSSPVATRPRWPRACWASSIPAPRRVGRRCHPTGLVLSSPSPPAWG